MTRRTLLGLGGAWVVLLGASHLIRVRQPDPPPAGDGQQTVWVDDVAVRYREWGDPTGSVLLLLHGSPGSGSVFNALAPALAPGRRVLAPDLPGFGRSTRRVADYSIAAHARYVQALLDSLAIRAADVIGFSLGGGVALELIGRDRPRVRSLVLLSSIGVQEHELLGDYWLNHALHGVQLVGFWVVQELLPHFGKLDGGMLDRAYARNFYDTDQRPLRDILAGWDRPTLILHGADDPLVPAAAAREHARIVPQSRLIMLDGNHFMTFLEPERLVRPIVAFLEDVARGTAPTREYADPTRMAEAAHPFDPRREPAAQGFALFIVLVLIAVATLVSEDLTCIAAGLLVARGSLALDVAILACLAGIWIGDLLLFAGGRTLGRMALRIPLLRRSVPPEDVTRASTWFRDRGGMAILVSRFVPGLRFPTYVAAGVLHVRFWWAAAWFLVAAVLWTPLLVGGTALLGRTVPIPSWPALLAVGLGLWLLMRLGIPACTWRGRRLLYGRWLRLTRWEFWPVWAVYAPLLPYIAWLAVKHRGLATFTAANPGLPAGGGFVGESKWDTLRRLPVARHGAAANGVVPTQLVPAGRVADRVAAVSAFMDGSRLQWPIALKPDVGERGTDVVVVHTLEDVTGYLNRVTRDVLVQAHAPGEEFGVFWYRRPGCDQGSIFAITTKRLPSVTADGRRTLEDLILADDRTVAQAQVFRRRFANRLSEVPPPGPVPLGDLGNHCRGATFFDGTELATPALTAAMDALSAHIAGFAIGRYDLMAPDREALRAGRGLAVIEVNGTSSEATSIYDPANGIRDAWRTLAAQWRLLYAIGAAQRHHGARPTPLGELLRHVWRWSREPTL